MSAPYSLPAPKTIRSRMLGSLYGLSVGDALGGPYEFRRRGSYTPSGEMEESHTFYTKDGKPLPKGSWTDDSSMALCLAESLREQNGFVWSDVAEKYCAWMDRGYMSVIDECFDIGNATRQGLFEFKHLKSLGQPLPSTSPMFNNNPNMGGNGSIMRLGPLPVFFWNPSTASQLYDTAAQSSYVTHSTAACVDGCVLMSAFMVGFLRAPEEWSTKEKKEKILNKDFRLEDYLPAAPESDTTATASSPSLSERLTSTQMRLVHLNETYKTKTVDEIRCSGFVVHTLEAALWALWQTETYEEGLLKLLPLGEDVDTVGAVYGAMAGACYGLEAIPQRWMNDLHKKEVLDQVYGGLVDLCGPKDE